MYIIQKMYNLFMLIYLILITFLSFVIVDFINVLNNKKLSLSLFILSLIGGVHLLDSFILQFFNIDFSILRLINITFVAILSLCLLIVLLIIIYKKRKQITKQIFINLFWRLSLFSIFSLIFVIFILFIKNNFSDTGLYLNLSSNYYMNSVLPSFNDPYRYSTSFYFYATMSNYYDIASFYNLFTPLIFYLVLSSILNDFINNVVHKNWLNQLSKLFIFTITCLLSIYFIPTTVSGNMYIQANLIVLVILLLLNKNIFSIPFMLLLSQFFSITGNILTMIISASLVIYFFLYKSMKNLFIIIAIASLSLITCGPTLPLSFSINATKIFSLIFIALFSITFITFIILYKSKHLSSKVSEFCFCHKFLKNKLWFITIMNVMLWVSIIILLLYFGISYKHNEFYDITMMIITSIIFGLLSTFISFKYKEKQMHYLWYLTTFVSAIISCLLFITKSDNASIWRITYSSIALPLPESSICIIFMSLYYLFYLLKNKTWNNKFLSFCCTKRKIFLPFAYLITLIGSFVPIIYSQCINFPYKIELISFSKNVKTNLNLFTSNDINLLDNINKSGNGKTFASDNMASMYLNKLNNLTVNFVKDMYSSYSITDDRYWCYNRLNFYNCKINNKGLNDLTINDVTSLLNSIIATSLPVDYLILDKNSPYFRNLNILGNIIEGDNIVIIQK